MDAISYGTAELIGIFWLAGAAIAAMIGLCIPSKSSPRADAPRDE